MTTRQPDHFDEGATASPETGTMRLVGASYACLEFSFFPFHSLMLSKLQLEKLGAA